MNKKCKIAVVLGLAIFVVGAASMFISKKDKKVEMLNEDVVDAKLSDIKDVLVGSGNKFFVIQEDETSGKYQIEDVRLIGFTLSDVFADKCVISVSVENNLIKEMNIKILGITNYNDINSDCEIISSLVDSINPVELDIVQDMENEVVSKTVFRDVGSIDNLCLAKTNIIEDGVTGVMLNFYDKNLESQTLNNIKAEKERLVEIARTKNA